MLVSEPHQKPRHEFRACRTARCSCGVERRVEVHLGYGVAGDVLTEQVKVVAVVELVVRQGAESARRGHADRVGTGRPSES